MFVVFRDSNAEPSPTAGIATSANRSEALAAPDDLAIDGPWELTHHDLDGEPSRVSLDALASWHMHDDESLRYFSGTATYRARFDVATDRLGDGVTHRLHLGDVQVIAEVELNGESLGVLWRPPFDVDVTTAVRPGENELVVRVTNLWRHRMIGEERLAGREDAEKKPNGTLVEDLPEGLEDPAGGPRIVSGWRHWHARDELIPSRLLGPVEIRSAATE